MQEVVGSNPGRVYGCSIVDDGDELGQFSPNTFLSIPVWVVSYEYKTSYATVRIKTLAIANTTYHVH